MIKNYFLIAILFLVGSCGEHFIQDSEYRRLVEKDFQDKKALLRGSAGDLLAVFDREDLSLAEKEALKFMYAYSPLIDISVYGGEYLLENIRHSMRVRKEMPWGEKIPEDIFRHFVLPVRGHNESLDSARFVFYRELKDRVKDCRSIEEAALEVNHWCHEKAIYKATNARTVAPVTLTTTTYGRCGEESVFALAALRSVGIPARQVYTPRWAHCDDNHAWIEVWADGVWKYLGACEPEPHLNMAWFTSVATRGIMMEAKVFGKYFSNEETVSMNANLTGVNVTGHYTDTKKLVVKVSDPNGDPVENALVEYKIYNYGEFHPAVALRTDKRGFSSLTMGLGDWLIWASKEKDYVFEKVNPKELDTLYLQLRGNTGEDYSCHFHLVPPDEQVKSSTATDLERAENDRRMTLEDSIRNRYIATFMSEKETRRKAEEWDYEPDCLVKYITGARGNYRQILHFLEGEKESPTERKMTAMALLEVIAGKDLQDITSEILTAHLDGAMEYYADYVQKPELFKQYVLNPRVKHEVITPYRQTLRHYLTDHGISTVEGIIGQIKRIQVNNRLYTTNIATPPVGVIYTGVTDKYSRDIFFVCACRTMGIPARLNPLDGKPQYDQDGEWKTVLLEEQRPVGSEGMLMLTYSGKEIQSPAYYTHFTISKIEEGRARSVDLGSNANVDMGSGALFAEIFRKPVKLESGDYLLVTGNRKSDGSVLASMKSFKIEPGKTTAFEMEITAANEKFPVLGKIDITKRFVPETKLRPQELLMPPSGYTVLVFIEANKEPANHLLRDMSALSADFDNKGIPMMFLFKDKEAMERFSREEFRTFPETMLLGYDYNGEISAMLRENMDLKTDNLPLVLLVNNRGEVIFTSEGYRVGMGRLIYRLLDY